MMKSMTRIRGALIVWISSYIFFLLTLANNFSAAHDSIHYLKGIATGTELFHQHHLLYHFLANKWLLFWQGFFKCGTLLPMALDVQSGFQKGRIFCKEHYIIESFTALWGSAVLTMVYLFFRNRFFLRRTLCLLGTGVVAFSYGVWFYSVNIEVYMPPLFFILCCLYVLTKRELTRGDVLKLALFHSFAILFHQVNILFTLVVVFVILRNQLYRAFIVYALVGFLLVATTYGFVGWFIEGHQTVGEWFAWVRGYTVGHDYWKPLSPKTPLYALTGFARAFVGGHFVFQLPFVEQLLKASFAEHGLRDENFLSASIGSATAWLLIVAACFLAIVICALAWRFARNMNAMKTQLYVIRPLLATLTVYSLFFLFWMPEILEFWILQMVIVWLLLLGMLPAYRFPFTFPLRTGVFIMMVLVFAVNFFGSMRWLRDASKDWYIVETQRIASKLKSGDLVIVNNEWILKDYLRYFTRATVIATDEPDVSEDKVQAQIESTRVAGGQVYSYAEGSLNLIE